jgi:lipopolysaccharide export system protein LptC
MTYWPLTDGQTANQPAGSRRAKAESSSSSEPDLRAEQTQSGGQHEAGPQAAAPSSAARTGGYLAIVSRRGARHVPTDSGMQRRRLMITGSKFALPAAAMLLLSLIGLWPELHIDTDRARISLSGISVGMDGARLTDAHYNGVDERGRPYTVTAATATQSGVERVDLTVPNADITLENGTWLNVRSKQGVYLRKDQQLDLSHDVVLYRDDGTTLTTAAATVALKDGAASSHQATHVEGPFGTLDAAGFTTVDKGAALEFWGPVRVELNGVSK